jgi:hypothetical protein
MGRKTTWITAIAWAVTALAAPGRATANAATDPTGFSGRSGARLVEALAAGARACGARCALRAYRRFIERVVELRDPEVGRFRARLLIPDGPGPFPAVLALHGHRGSPWRFARTHLVRGLVRRAFVVVLPGFRLMGCGREEERISRRLLRSGFTLIGLRVYEALRTSEYLRSRAVVDPDRVGLLGHSGGSTVALLLARIDDGYGAAVFDHLVGFRDRCRLWGRVHCETVPSIFPIASDVRDLSSLAGPHMAVRYGFPGPDLRREVLDFLSAQLATDGRPGPDSRAAPPVHLGGRKSRSADVGEDRAVIEGRSVPKNTERNFSIWAGDISTGSARTTHWTPSSHFGVVKEPG